MYAASWLQTMTVEVLIHSGLTAAVGIGQVADHQYESGIVACDVRLSRRDIRQGNGVHDVRDRVEAKGPRGGRRELPFSERYPL
jgi:hypothetical protein